MSLQEYRPVEAVAIVGCLGLTYGYIFATVVLSISYALDHFIWGLVFMILWIMSSTLHATINYNRLKKEGRLEPLWPFDAKESNG